MSKLFMAFTIVLILNLLMISTQNAVLEINPENTFYTGEGGILEQHNVETANPYDDLPGSGSSVESETGNIFTDIVGGFLSWISEKTGFDTIIKALRAPYNYLAAMGLPEDMVNLLGTAWYLLTLTLLVLTIFGRQL